MVLRALSLTSLMCFAVGCAASPADPTVEADATRGAPVSLRTVSLRPETGEMSFSYGIGGGCAEHTPQTTVELVKSAGEITAKVSVVDVASAPDFCEAFLTLEGKASLKSLVVAEARRVGMALGDSVVLDLPTASASIESAGPAALPATGAKRTPVDAVSHLALDGRGQLTFAYTIGGGCAAHDGHAKVELVTAPGAMRAKVTVEDVSSEPDFCEALIGVEGTVDLHALVSDAARKAGKEVDGRQVEIELPRPRLRL